MGGATVQMKRCVRKRKEPSRLSMLDEINDPPWGPSDGRGRWNRLKGDSSGEAPPSRTDH